MLLGQERAARQRRGEIYSLGQLVMIATHSPKTFPKPDEFIDRRRRRGSADAEIRAYFAERVATHRAKPTR
ncbi:hypothetical protein [Pseudooceanicola marinus]|uniref:hypothetical protein n=1 Tax=Pseudooceanicola marinus TaxID=396013 RepID=UPI000A268E42|nr:hypothetical protein [Pseudooceanicola marinus]PJE32672.1 hypothetical protein CVM50_07195 [Pseudooceanicola marinus]